MESAHMKQKSNPEAPSEVVGSPWGKSSEEILEALGVSAEEGLTASEASQRRKKYGSNRIDVTSTKSAWSIFRDQFKNFIVALLAVAGIVSFAFAQWLEGVAIYAVLLINVLIGFFTELRATRSMEALQSLTQVTAKVIRDGRAAEIPADELVPGDIVLLEGGDIVSADLRLTEASRLKVNESALTGESVSVSKKIDPLPGDVTLADRTNMVFKGTSIDTGSGRGIVVATGRGTELGTISSLVEEGEEELTPLEQRLQRLGNILVWITLSIAAGVLGLGLIAGRDTLLVIETAVALAVAAVPEGLPIVATIALARGMWRMSRRNALINRLSSVETLGAIDTVCTDKTGTLTENRMSVAEFAIQSNEMDILSIKVEDTEESKSPFRLDGTAIEPTDEPALWNALTTGVLCNNAYLNEVGGQDNGSESIGDPLEAALLVVGKKADIRRDELLDPLPEVREESFDPELKMMATVHRDSDRYRYAVKGAPEAVIEHCTHVVTRENRESMTPERTDQWLDCNQHMADNGLRVMAVACKWSDSPDDDAYSGLALIGLIGLADPPRADIKRTIKKFHNAGIKVIMVTGDQPATARNVGSAVGLSHGPDSKVVHGADLAKTQSMSEEDRRRLLETTMFARVTPKQKLELVENLRARGSVVAMTGDGVNDAPALKRADVGIAMGLRGTQVAREAADVVLKDDSFGTIAVAVEQGRAIFDNIRKFVVYLLSGNVGEILIVSFAFVASTELPILPLQILYLNMIGDVFPALALGIGKGHERVMQRPPRDSSEPILTNRHWAEIIAYGVVLAATVLGAFFLSISWLGMQPGHAVTISFLTVSFARIFHTFNMKDWGANVLVNDVTTNLYVWGAVVLCTGLLLVAVYVPVLAMVLHLEPPSAHGWGLIMGMSILPVILIQVVKSGPVSRLLRHETIRT